MTEHDNISLEYTHTRTYRELGVRGVVEGAELLLRRIELHCGLPWKSHLTWKFSLEIRKERIEQPERLTLSAIMVIYHKSCTN